MKKGKIIAITGIAGSVLLLITLMVLNARPYLNIDQIYSNPQNYDAKKIQVIGTVNGFDGGNFNLTENDLSLLIDVTNCAIPENLTNGIEVVVEGIYHQPSTVAASIILVQCS